MMTTIFLLVVGIWAVINSVERAMILAALRKQDARWQEQAQLIARQAELNSCIADNAKEGARFVLDCRKRIERLERITASRAEGPN
jgi:hypothetical protein